METLLKVIKGIKPDGLNYLWINGYDFKWNNNHWELLNKYICYLS